MEPAAQRRWKMAMAHDTICPPGFFVRSWTIPECTRSAVTSLTACVGRRRRDSTIGLNTARVVPNALMSMLDVGLEIASSLSEFILVSE
jgi:hypothetical protein